MKPRKIYRILIILALGFFGTQAVAEMKGVAHFGYEMGGDGLLDVDYDNGSSSDIDAGDGLVMAGGVAYLFNPQVAIQTTVGLKYQTIQQAENGGADLTRFPLEAIAQFTMGKARLGAGYTYHLSPKLSASGILSDSELSFDDALGTVLQLDYVTDLGLIFGARYTDMAYTIKNTSIDVDAGSFGFHIAGQF